VIWLLGTLLTVVVAGSLVGLLLRGTPAEPRAGSGLMHPLASPFWLIAPIPVAFVVLLPLIVLHNVMVPGQFWPEESPPIVVLESLAFVVVALVIVALVIVALWGVVFAPWWQPLYLFLVIALPLVIIYWDPNDPSWRGSPRGAVLFAAGIAALAATGIILRFLIGGLLGLRLPDARALPLGARAVGGFFIGVILTLACLPVLFFTAAVVVSVVIRDAYWGGWLTGYFIVELWPVWLIALLVGGVLGARRAMRDGPGHSQPNRDPAAPLLG
jgi:hypothetical protein